MGPISNREGSTAISFDGGFTTSIGATLAIAKRILRYNADRKARALISNYHEKLRWRIEPGWPLLASRSRGSEAECLVPRFEPVDEWRFDHAGNHVEGAADVKSSVDSSDAQTGCCKVENSKAGEAEEAH